MKAILRFMSLSLCLSLSLSIYICTFPSTFMYPRTFMYPCTFMYPSTRALRPPQQVLVAYAADGYLRLTKIESSWNSSHHGPCIVFSVQLAKSLFKVWFDFKIHCCWHWHEKHCVKQPHAFACTLTDILTQNPTKR